MNPVKRELNYSPPRVKRGVGEYLKAVPAALLVIASAGFGSVFAWQTGQHHGLPLAILAVTMALGLELAKPLAVVGALRALTQWRIGTAIGLSALALVAIAYSFTAELQLMATSRANVVAERSEHASADQKAKLAELKAELRAIGHARSVAEMKPLVAQTELLAGDCRKIVSVTQREACKRLPELQSEAAKAAAIAAVKVKVAEVEGQIATAKGSREADPAMAALATYLAVFGFAVAPATLADVIVLIGVLALEVGSATAGLLVAAGVTAGARPLVQAAEVQPSPVRLSTVAQTAPLDQPDGVTVDQSTDQPDQRHPLALDQPDEATVDRPLSRRGCIKAPETRTTTADAILDQLRRAGGKAAGSERQLAEAIGASRSTYRRALHSLVAAGVVAKAGEALILRASA